MLPGFWSLFPSPHHSQRAAVILKATTLFKFHDILKKRKYRLLYTARRKGKPGPKGPSQELIEAIVEMNRQQALQAKTKFTVWLPSYRAGDQQSVRIKHR
jgi:hypothetical protein